jgi:GntR family transcriptional regulator
MSRRVNGATPSGEKARRLYLMLREEILRGDYPEGSRLPGEPRLAAGHDVSRVTVRRALEALESDGLISRRPGSGTQVRAGATQRARISADFATLMPLLVEIGRATQVRLLSCAYAAAPASVARALMLTPPARVQTAVRLRTLDTQPFSHLTTHVPEDIASHFSEADLATTPLFRLLERGGVRIASAEQSVTATLAAPEVAELLEVSVGAALLSIERVVRDDAGRGVEYLSALYRPDMFRFEMTLNRISDGGTGHWAPIMDEPRHRNAAEQ